jgi:hypothetical protein
MRPHCISSNGYERPVISINRMIPAPAIQVCQGDIIDATVFNHLRNGEVLVFIGMANYKMEVIIWMVLV